MTALDTIRFTLWALWEHRVTHMRPGSARSLQLRRLRRLLSHAVAHSPFYRDRYAGIDVSHCDLDDLPTTSKPEVMANFDRVVTDPEVRRADLERFVDDDDNAGQLFLGRYHACHTSGSQGQPLLILQDLFGLDLLFAFQMTRGNPTMGTGPVEAFRRYFEPARLAAISSRRGFFPSASAWPHAPAAFLHYVDLKVIGAGDPHLVDQLNDFQPTVLTAYPSVLEVLALQPDRLRLAPALRQVVSISETLTDAARERIERAFGVPLLDTYASGECLFLSNGCHAGRGMHVNADWAILEVVDEQNRPVPPGESGHKVLLTNLANTVQPFIRYEIGDRVVMADRPCGCGNRLPRIERVEGRSADFFWVRVGDGYRALTSHPFKNAFDYVREVREWQAIQEARNRLLVRVEMLPGTTLDRPRATRLLNDYLKVAGVGGHLDVRLDVVPRLEPDSATGKLRRMVSRVGVPSDLRTAGQRESARVSAAQPVGAAR